MHYNNRNRPRASVYGCSSTTLIIGLIILLITISGVLFFILRNFGLILALGIVIWFFRKFILQDRSDKNTPKDSRPKSWSRNYEENKNTSYDNIEREFEEIDDEEEE